MRLCSANLGLKLCIYAVLAAVVFGPTNLCRSASTDILGGYVIVSEAYRRQRIGKHFVKTLLAEVEKCSDYNGVITNVFITYTPALLLCKSVGFVVTACVRNSGTVSGHGVTDALVMHYQTSKSVTGHSKI